MEASDLTILLFFLLVMVVLIAFFLWLYISHRSTPPSQRLALWLKSQSEADLLVDTMAAQTECVLDGLRLCRHRNSQKRLRLQHRAAEAQATVVVDTSAALGPPTSADRRHQAIFWTSRVQDCSSLPSNHHSSQGHHQGHYQGHHQGNHQGHVNEQEQTEKRDQGSDGMVSASVVPNEWQSDPDMDEIWRRQHQHHRWGGCSGTTGHQHQQEQQQQQVQLADLEELAQDRTWEYVVGWCLIGCVFAGITIILTAAIQVQNDPGHEETHWSFSQEGDSLMDSVISHIMRIAAGVHDFDDQWMEQGIFVFVLGINGFLLIRQRVFARRRQYETMLWRHTLHSPSLDRTAPRRYPDTAATAATDKSELDEEQLVDGDDEEEDGPDKHRDGQQRTRYVPDRGFDRYPEFMGKGSTILPISGSDPPQQSLEGNDTWSGNGEKDDSHGDHRSKPKSKGKATQDSGTDQHRFSRLGTGGSERYQDEEEDDSDDDTPDFRTMSFVAWFNYLQVGILVIEFLQLFSFPLRELMEFYNQVARTSAMYESAKGILNAIQTASLTVQDMANQGLHGFRYSNGTLSFGHSPLFRFTGALPLSIEKTPLADESNKQAIQTDDAEIKASGQASPASVQVHQQSIGEGGVVKVEQDSTMKLGTAILNSTQTGASNNLTSLDDWKSKMPKIDDATSYMTPWIKNLTDSAEWITHNMPRLLPNLTALLFNTTTLPNVQHSLENIKDTVVNVTGASLHGALGNITDIVSSLTQAGVLNSTTNGGLLSPPLQLPHRDNNTTTSGSGTEKVPMKGDGDIVLQVVNALGLQPSINTHDWYLLRLWSCVAVVALGWVLALFIHAWNRRSRSLLRAGKSYWPPISVGWVSCFIPVVSVLYLPILGTFLSSAACQSQAIHAYAHEKFERLEEQARLNGEPGRPQRQVSGESVLNQFILALLDPASTVSHPATSLLCTGPTVHPPLYMAISLLAFLLAHLLFMVFLTSFEREPVKGEICFRPHGVAILKNLGLLLAVDFLLIQAPSQRRFRGLVSIAIMLAMACYTIKRRPCYWNKLNYWRTFSFSCVLYASLLVALLCPSPIPDQVQGRRVGGRWTMAPNLDMGHAWLVSGGPKVLLAWIAAGWLLLIIVFVAAERFFLQPWTRKRRRERRQIKEEEDTKRKSKQKDGKEEGDEKGCDGGGEAAAAPQRKQQQEDGVEGYRNGHDLGSRGEGESGDVYHGEGVGVGWLASLGSTRTTTMSSFDRGHGGQGFIVQHDSPWATVIRPNHNTVAFPTYQPSTPSQSGPSPSVPHLQRPATLAATTMVERLYHTNDLAHSSWKQGNASRIDSTLHQQQRQHNQRWNQQHCTTPPGFMSAEPSRKTGADPRSTSQWVSPMTEIMAAQSHWSIVDLGREEHVDP